MAEQVWGAIVHLPHCRREVHVAFELGAASAALAIATMAHSATFFFSPLDARKIFLPPRCVAHTTSLRHAKLAYAGSVNVDPLLRRKLGTALLPTASAALPGTHAFGANYVGRFPLPPTRSKFLFWLHCCTTWLQSEPRRF